MLIASRFGLSHASLAIVWVLTGIVACSGCGGAGAPSTPPAKPVPVGKVHGKVTLKGQPAPEGTGLTFVGNNSSLSVVVGSDGTYTASNVPAGQCKVRVENPTFSDPAASASAPTDFGFPQKYLKEATSGETVDVKEGADVEYNLDMKAE